MKNCLIKVFAAMLLISGMMMGPFLGSAQADAETAGYAAIDLKNTTYTAEVKLTGEDGVGQIQTPTSVYVKDQKATIVLVWDSNEYNYMIVDGEKISPKSREDGSVFWIPVTAWDEEMPLLVSKGFENPEELSCSLYIDTATIKKQGTMAPLYALIVLNIVLAFLNGLNMVRKKKLFAERVESEKEAKKFAKQQEKKPAQTYQPPRRLVLDENGTFVTSDVFERAKTYAPKPDGSASGQDAPAPQLWWRRTGEETLIIDRKEDQDQVKEIRPQKVHETGAETEDRSGEKDGTKKSDE